MVSALGFSFFYFMFLGFGGGFEREVHFGLIGWEWVIAFRVASNKVVSECYVVRGNLSLGVM